MRWHHRLGIRTENPRVGGSNPPLGTKSRQIPSSPGYNHPRTRPASSTDDGTGNVRFGGETGPTGFRVPLLHLTQLGHQPATSTCAESRTYRFLTNDDRGGDV